VLLLALILLAGRRFEYYQLMAGFALIELSGMVFLFKALKKKIPGFDSGRFTPDLLKIILCLGLIFPAAVCATTALDGIVMTARWLALIQIVAGALTFAAVGIHCLWMCRYFSADEMNAVRGTFSPLARAKQ
ncbi:MAG: hypothetical protein KJ645_10650, partial [Planctomycetes bacterium]|nr:hypothetical protein [Planctomycetota bacterium]